MNTTSNNIAGAAPAAVAGPAALREAFEAAMKKLRPHSVLSFDGEGYKSPWEQAAWTGWNLRTTRIAMESASTQAAPALEAPPAVAPQGEYPHEQMDAMALARYKVVPSHASMLWSHAVVAGDGAQQLYVGREVECQNMARKFAGAFLDGAFAFHSMAAAPTAQAAPALEAPAVPSTVAVKLTEAEMKVLRGFAAKSELPMDRVLIQALRLYQAHNGEPPIRDNSDFYRPMAAAPQAPAKGLPYEPTSDMLIAGRACDPALPVDTVRAIWWAMWRTAPQAPAAPVVDAGDQVLGEWPRVSGVGRDAESPRTLLLYLQTEASDDELRAIHDALLDGGALATHALSELMHIGYRVEGGKLVPPENLSVRASEFFGVTAVAAKATAAHSDDLAVDRFAAEMKSKLAAARAKGRGGWETCPPEVLSRMLREHTEKGDPRDVANFCMFLWCLGHPIGAAPAAPAVDAKAHDWRENASYGGEICAECGAAKGSRRGNAPCAWPPEPLDVCTDPYNCARCKAHPNHRKGLEHAGISRPRSAAQTKEGDE
ncbi:hypothetical protein [Delftia tsuruhatensis]|uniref:hypothetical protein n=1 Tax=Delftia tsuruhatensis TaxID=180282 RepID=UPI0030D3A335